AHHVLGGDAQQLRGRQGRPQRLKRRYDRLRERRRLPVELGQKRAISRRAHEGGVVAAGGLQRVEVRLERVLAGQGEDDLEGVLSGGGSGRHSGGFASRGWRRWPASSRSRT